MPTEQYPETPVIKGHDFNSGRDIDAIMASMYTTGFQATALGQAVNEVNRMVRHGCSAWGGPFLCCASGSGWHGCMGCFSTDTGPSWLHRR